MTQNALVVGATGIAGSAIVRLLLDHGWDVAGLSRSPAPQEGLRHIAGDLLDAAQLSNALKDAAPNAVPSIVLAGPFKDIAESLPGRPAMV